MYDHILVPVVPDHQGRGEAIGHQVSYQQVTDVLRHDVFAGKGPAAENPGPPLTNSPEEEGEGQQE